MLDENIVYKDVGMVKKTYQGLCQPRHGAIATPSVKARKLEQLLEPSKGLLARKGTGRHTCPLPPLFHPL